jgi:hypothetical protein
MLYIDTYASKRPARGQYPGRAGEHAALELVAGLAQLLGVGAQLLRGIHDDFVCGVVRIGSSPAVAAVSGIRS